MTLRYHITTGPAARRVVLHGDIDRDAAPVLDDAASAAVSGAPAAIEPDFAPVDYINSTGIALIVGFLAKARAAGIPIRAEGLTDHYRHIFEITRLSDFIEIVQPASR